MQSITSESDIKLIDSQPQSIIFFYVEWSVYTLRGREVMNEVESALASPAVAFWFADVSDLDAPAAFMFDWLLAKRKPDANLSLVSLGSASIVWLQSGVVVDFLMSLAQNDARAIVDRTKKNFRV